MAENYTAVPTPYDGSTPMVEDGDPLDAASVRAGMEKHADAIRSVQGAVTPAAAGITTAITRTVFAMPGFLEDAEYDSANMRVQETADAADATVRSNVIWDLPLPHGATLNSVYVDGAGTTLPAVLGSLYVQYMDATTGVGDQVGVVVDPSASGAAFGARHAVTLSGLSFVVDRTIRHLRIQYRGHHNSGGGAMTIGTRISHPLVTFVPSAVDLGAG